MKQAEHIEDIDRAWGSEGFLGSLKDGLFSSDLYDVMYQSLLKVNIREDEAIDKELVRLLWFIPVFMYRFKQHFPEVPSNEYDALREGVEEQLARIFGYP